MNSTKQGQGHRAFQSNWQPVALVSKYHGHANHNPVPYTPHGQWLLRGIFLQIRVDEIFLSSPAVRL